MWTTSYPNFSIANFTGAAISMSSSTIKILGGRFCCFQAGAIVISENAFWSFEFSKD
jgi:hypothetical protein